MFSVGTVHNKADMYLCMFPALTHIDADYAEFMLLTLNLN